ncbi:MAG: hypothetical protein E7591_00835 [Ruminococcaceae bacterium]|nr:hypothetical protein [Oscillospiraceae bacterium]
MSKLNLIDSRKLLTDTMEWAKDKKDEVKFIMLDYVAEVIDKQPTVITPERKAVRGNETD